MTRLDRQSASLGASLAAAADATAHRDLEQLRAPWPADDPALLRPRPLPDVVDMLVPGDPAVPVRVFTADADVPCPALVWLHPGGFVAGQIDDIDGVCRTLAADGRCTVVSIEYRLAPEHPFPAGLDDVCTVVSWLDAHAATLGIAAGRLAIGGQSAGATLAAAAALRLRKEGAPTPMLQVLAYPVLDPALDAPSFAEHDGCVYTTADLRWSWDCYLGELRCAPPALAAPLYAEDLTGVAPALIVAAGHDPARDDSRRYAAALAEAAVDCELVEFPGTIHAFLSFAGILDVAQEALELITTRLREHLSPTSGGLHHVGLPYPTGRERDVRAFYGGVLGLAEKPVPAALAERPFIWFAAGAGSELHLIPEPRLTATSRERHACLRTDRLDELVARLRHRGYHVDRYEEIVNRRQAFVHDPFGNLLELTELAGVYA